MKLNKLNPVPCINTKPFCSSNLAGWFSSNRILEIKSRAVAVIPFCSSPMGRSAAEKKAAKDTSKKDVNNKQKDSTQAAQDKKDQSNMLTQLKKGDTTEKVQTLQLYQSLPRFSDEKLELLKKWKLDKSCKWIASYKETRSMTQTTKHQEKDGFATKYLSTLFMISLCQIDICDSIVVSQHELLTKIRNISPAQVSSGRDLQASCGEQGTQSNFS